MKNLPLTQRPLFARRILEIGGGHAPYAGVTHAVDKFPADNSQRAGNLKMAKGVVFRQGDLENIPFISTERFDFIYVSHVLEHVHDPARAITEINRVAERGYIETPSPLREQLSCPLPYDPTRDFHTLFAWCGADAGSLHVIAKTSATVANFCDCTYGRLARRLFELQRAGQAVLEPLLPRGAKTTRLYFKNPVSISIHPDFVTACRSGHCGYHDSVREAIRWTKLPFRWISGRFERLRTLIRI